ncbi:hypothetical protein [Sphingomonas sp.]|uniref:hypothetical protein n=1 Tax=Sphingomonas sp. TaxID=28214 RepID=UPI003B006FED
MAGGGGDGVGRAELIAAMATTDIRHGKARPDEKGWCQGYVAGAVCNGFLSLADAKPPAEPVVNAT